MKTKPLPAFEATVTANTPTETNSWRVEAETLTELRTLVLAVLDECHPECHPNVRNSDKQWGQTTSEESQNPSIKPDLLAFC